MSGAGTLFQFFKRKEPAEAAVPSNSDSLENNDLLMNDPSRAQGTAEVSAGKENMHSSKSKKATKQKRDGADVKQVDAVHLTGKEKSRKGVLEPDASITKSKQMSKEPHVNHYSRVSQLNNPFKILMESSKKKGVWDKSVKAKDDETSDEEYVQEKVSSSQPSKDGASMKFFSMFSMKSPDSSSLANKIESDEITKDVAVKDKQAGSKKKSEKSGVKLSKKDKGHVHSNEKSSSNSSLVTAETSKSNSKRKQSGKEATEEAETSKQKIRPKSSSRGADHSIESGSRTPSRRGKKRFQLIYDSSDFEEEITRRSSPRKKPTTTPMKKRLSSIESCNVPRSSIATAQRLLKKSRQVQSKSTNYGNGQSVELRSISKTDTSKKYAKKASKKSSAQSGLSAHSMQRINSPAKRVSSTTEASEAVTPTRRSSRIANRPQYVTMNSSDVEFTPEKRKRQRHDRGESGNKLLRSVERRQNKGDKSRQKSSKGSMEHRLMMNKHDSNRRGEKEIKLKTKHSAASSRLTSGKIRTNSGSSKRTVEDDSDVMEVTPGKPSKRRRKGRSTGSSSSSDEVIVMKKKNSQASKPTRPGVDAFSLLRHGGRPPPPPQESPGKIAARKAFLESGVPQQLVVQAEIARELEASMTPMFPEISHVTQRSDDTEKHLTEPTLEHGVFAPVGTLCKELNHLRWIEHRDWATCITPKMTTGLLKKQQANEIINGYTKLKTFGRDEKTETETDDINRASTGENVENGSRVAHDDIQIMPEAALNLQSRQEAGEHIPINVTLSESAALSRSPAFSICAGLDLSAILAHLQRLTASRQAALSAQSSTSQDATTSAADRDHPPSSCTSLWTELYRPATPDAFLAGRSAAAATELRAWLEEWRSPAADAWDENSDETLPDSALLLIGPSGAGKTSAVYAAANQLGIQVLEFSASHRRSGRHLAARLSEATQSHKVALPGGTAGSTGVGSGDQADGARRSLILLEDVQLIADEQDDGFLAAAVNLAASAKRPVVLTSDDDSITRTRLLRSMPHRVIEVPAPRPEELAKLLQLTAMVQGYAAGKDIVEGIAKEVGLDARKGLLQLQIMCESIPGGTIQTKSVLQNVSHCESTAGDANVAVVPNGKKMSTKAKNCIIEDSGSEGEESCHKISDSVSLLEKSLALVPHSLATLTEKSPTVRPHEMRRLLPFFPTRRLARRESRWRLPKQAEKKNLAGVSRKKRWRALDSDLWSDDEDFTEQRRQEIELSMCLGTDRDPLPKGERPADEVQLLTASVQALAEMYDNQSMADAVAGTANLSGGDATANVPVCPSWWVRQPAPDMSEKERPVCVTSETAVAVSMDLEKAICDASVRKCGALLSSAVSTFQEKQDQRALSDVETMTVPVYCEETVTKRQAWNDNGRLTPAVPSVMLARNTLCVDLLPSIRNICRLECLRRALDGSRTRRFLHYLDQVGLHTVPTDLRERICSSLT